MLKHLFYLRFTINFFTDKKFFRSLKCSWQDYPLKAKKSIFSISLKNFNSCLGTSCAQDLCFFCVKFLKRILLNSLLVQSIV